VVDLQAEKIILLDAENISLLGWSADSRFMLMQQLIPVTSGPNRFSIYLYDFSSDADPVITRPARFAASAAWLSGSNRIAIVIDGASSAPGRLILFDAETGEQKVIADNVEDLLYTGR
jgi:hypothetical protein